MYLSVLTHSSSFLLFVAFSSFCVTFGASVVFLSLRAPRQDAHAFFMSYTCGLTYAFQPHALIPGVNGSAHSIFFVEVVGAGW